MNARSNTLILGLVLAPASAFGGEAPSLEALLAHARAHSPVIQAERAAVDRAEGGRRQAWSVWRPQLSASGEARWFSVEAELDFADVVQGLAPGLGIDPTPFLADLPPPTQIQPHWSAVGVLRLRQLVYDPRAWHGPALAEAGARRAEAALAQTERDVLFGVIRIVLGLESLAALDAAAARAVDVAQQRAAEAKTLVEAGAATPLDVSRAETARIEAESQRATLAAEQARLLAELRALAGWDEPLAVAPQRVEPARLMPPGSGPADRPELAARRAEVEAAERQLRATGQRWLPTVVAEGQVSYASFGGFADERLQATAFLGLQLPLYDGGARYADADVSRADVARARAGLEAQRRTLDADAVRAEAAVTAARARLELARAQLETAAATVQQVELQAREGLATSLDLQSADAQRFAADRNLAEQTLALSLSELELSRAFGGRVVTQESSP